jgi:hypothetical protein
MNLARVSCTAMFLSGAAAVASPVPVAMALRLIPQNARGRAEVRAGLGGTYAALGGWALLVNSASARRAVGVTWLGAAVARLASLHLDEPETDAAFWAYLAAEIGLGAGALLTAGSRPN